MHASKAAQQSLVILCKRAEFVALNAVQTKWVSHGLVVQVMPNDLGCRRVGYTVTKKTDKSAVVRNRIKRRLRAVAAEVLPFGTKEGMDYVLIGRPATAAREYEQLCRDLKWCLGKLGCLMSEA